MAKYEFTGEVKVVGSITLRQIRAVAAIAAIGVAAGDVGGWIEKEENLSQVYGDAWVSGNAQVYGNAWVYGDARVSGNAQVYGDARVSGNAQVYGDAQVSGNAQVYGNARVSGNAQVYGDARVSGNAQVYGDAWVSGNAQVYGNAWVYGDARVSGNAQVETCLAIATRSDGYTFAIFAQKDGPLIITAGCRFFTIPEARAHWRATRLGTQLGYESLALVDHLERMAGIQGLKDNTRKQAAE